MLGFEVSPVVQYVIAFAIIAALLGLFAIVLRRIGGKRFTLPGQDRGRGRQPRLGIVDVYDLDRQRQLVLLRRDNVEHLVMLGGPNDLVVESNIVRVPIGRAPAAGEFAERLAQPEAGHEQVRPQEQGRPQLDPAIAASAGVAVNGLAAREQAQREPALQQRPQAAPPAPPQPRPQAGPGPARLEPVQQQALQPAALHPVAAHQPEQSAPAQPPLAQPSSLTSSIPPQPSPVPPAVSPLARPAATAPAVESAPRSELKPVEPVVTAAPPPPPEPKRGLFGFGRAVEPAAPMPAFPSRPRATPVAPDFTPQRTPLKFAPAGAEKPGVSPGGAADASRNAPEAVEKPAATAEPAVADKPALVDKPVLAEKPNAPEKVAASAAQPKPGRALDDALLSDMTRQLEAALKRPSAAPQPSATQPSAVPAPSVTPPPARTAQPSAASPADAPSEPKLYKPVATAAAAAATVAAVASVFRSSVAPQPTGPSSPVPPRPYGGAEEPAASASLSKGKAAGEDETDDVTLQNGGASIDQPTPVAVSESIEIATEQVASEPSGAAAATPEGEPIVLDRDEDLRELPPETIEPAATDAAQEQKEVVVRPAPVADVIGVDAAPDAGSKAEEATEEAPEEARQEASDAGLQGVAQEGLQENLQENLQSDSQNSEEAEKPAGETAPEPSREPAPVIDPFSVDEIEAEFARLLGRSVEKDPKNP